MSEALSPRGNGIGKGAAIILLGLLALVVLINLARGIAPAIPQAQPQATQQAGQCPTTTPSGGPVFIVRLSRSKFPETTQHIYDARLKGKPYLLTLDRPGAKRRSNQALAGYPSRAPKYERDEYPPAIAKEGGKGADVRYIDASDNAGAGAAMGNALRGKPDGLIFCLELVP